MLLCGPRSHLCLASILYLHMDTVRKNENHSFVFSKEKADLLRVDLKTLTKTKLHLLTHLTKICFKIYLFIFLNTYLSQDEEVMKLCLAIIKF